MGHPSYTLTKELFIKNVATKINNALDEIDSTLNKKYKSDLAKN